MNRSHNKSEHPRAAEAGGERINTFFAISFSSFYFVFGYRFVQADDRIQRT